MIKPYSQDGTHDTPKVILDKSLDAFLIQGRSMPEDASYIFRPIHHWLKEYSEDPNPLTRLEFDLEYFNSSTLKELIRILRFFEEMKKEGHTIEIVWCFEDGDDLMEIKGEELKSIIKIPFKMKIKH